MHVFTYIGFPGYSAVKNLFVSAGDTGDVGSIPGLGRSPRGGNGIPLQDSYLKIPWTEEPGRLQSVRLQRSDMTEYTYFITSPSLFLGGPLWPLHSHASGSPLLPHHAPPTHPAPRVSDLRLPGPLSLSAPVPFLFLFTHSVLFVWACVCFFRKTVDSFESKNLFMPAPVA